MHILLLNEYYPPDTSATAKMAELNSAFSGGDGVVTASHLVVADTEVVERHGKLGEKGVGTLVGELAVDADSFVSSLERLLGLPEVS